MSSRVLAWRFSSCNISDLVNDEQILRGKLDAFARCHPVRAGLQVLTFFVLLWALFSAGEINAARLV
jgi:hypothetical protein